MTQSQPHIVIVGGGMVGLSLALLLDQAGCDWRITVLEAYEADEAETRDNRPRYRPSFDARSCALSQHSRQVFERLGVWDEMSAHVAAIESIDVSERGQVGGTLMTAAEQKLPALGYVIENMWLGAVLSHAVTDRERITVKAPATPVAVKSLKSGVEITLKGAGEVLLADLLVVADGVHSSTRDQLGIGVERRDYGQMALITNVLLDRPHDGIAWERFTPAGPMALLPLPTHERTPRAALVWTMAPTRAAELNRASEDEFLAVLHEQFGYRAGCIVRAGQRFTYPLQLVAALEQCRRHVVVVGNAAHSLHPVAGQGFNLSLRDIDRLARVLRERWTQPGELAVLQEYVQRSQGDQSQTILLSDSLPRIFNHDSWPLTLGRNLGLLSLDGVPPLRRAFARRGMGFNP